ncbi:hypothetical protein ES703_71729 [subsurface metagenome]
MRVLHRRPKTPHWDNFLAEIPAGLPLSSSRRSQRRKLCRYFRCSGVDRGPSPRCRSPHPSPTDPVLAPVDLRYAPVSPGGDGLSHSIHPPTDQRTPSVGDCGLSFCAPPTFSRLTSSSLRTDIHPFKMLNSLHSWNEFNIACPNFKWGIGRGYLAGKFPFLNSAKVAKNL